MRRVSTILRRWRRCEPVETFEPDQRRAGNEAGKRIKQIDPALWWLFLPRGGGDELKLSIRRNRGEEETVALRSGSALLLPLHDGSSEIRCRANPDAWLIEFELFPRDQEPADQTPSLPDLVFGLMEPMADRNGEAQLDELRVRAVLQLVLAEALEARDEGEDWPEFVEHVRTHLEGDLSMPVLAEAMNTSPESLRARVRRCFGVAPSEFVGEERFRLARKLLGSTDLPIENIAARTGYGDRFAFSRAFKRHNGRSPAAFRREMEGAFGEIGSPAE